MLLSALRHLFLSRDDLNPGSKQNCSKPVVGESEPSQCEPSPSRTAAGPGSKGAGGMAYRSPQCIGNPGHLEQVSFSPAWRPEDGLNDPCKSPSALCLSGYLLSFPASLLSLRKNESMAPGSLGSQDDFTLWPGDSELHGTETLGGLEKEP